jgi:iron complex outermembrane receptor protein
MSPPKNMTAGLPIKPAWGEDFMRIAVTAVAICMSIVGLFMADDAHASIEQLTNIPAQPLGAALQSLAKDRNFQIVYASEDIGDRRTAGAVGEYTPEEALKQLLRGTGLTYKYLDENTVAIVSPTPAPPPSTPRQSRGEKGGQKATDSFRLAERTQAGPVADVSVAGKGPGEQGSQKAPDALEEIIVTANKREESLSKVGLTIQALGGAQLEQEHIASLEDLATAVPGLTFTQSDSNTPVYTLRGIGFYDTTLAAYPSVSVYLDQAPLSFPVLTKLTLFDIERVEVLKGPQGTLFGNNATGGAINYIAAKPTEDFRAGVSLDEARFDTFTTDAYISGPVAENLLARFAFRVQEGNGWQESVSRPGDSNGAPEQFAARLLFDWRPFQALRVQTDVNAWLDRTQPPQAQFVEFIPSFPTTSPLPIPLVPNATNNPRAADWSPLLPPYANNRLAQAVIRADYDVTNSIALTSMTSYTNYRQMQRPDDDGVSAIRVDVSPNDGYINSLYQEFRLADNSDPLFRWTVGANYGHDVTDERDATDQRDGTPNYTYVFGGFHFAGNTFTNRQIMSNYAGFADASSTIGEFTLKAGVRYTEADRHSENCNLGYTQGEPNGILDFFEVLASEFFGHPTTIPNGSCIIFNKTYTELHEFEGTLDQNNVSWRTGLDWNPTDTVLTYLDVAKGYKAGSFPALSGSTDVAYTPVTQESVLTYEVGTKTQWLDHRLSVDLSAFYSDYRNKQIKSELDDPIFGPLNALVNIPKSTIKGFEPVILVHPVAGLTLGGSLTYLDAKLVEANNIVSLYGTPGNWSGNPIPYTSKWNAATNANYAFPFPWWDAEAFVGGQAAYRSGTTSSIGNEPQLQLPGYSTIDVQSGLNFAQGRYRVMLWGKNITNRFYLTNVIRYADGISRLAGMPATYGVTVSFKY